VVYSHLLLENTPEDFPGCGIPQADMERIFEPFFTTRQGGHGTGLGLAIAYGIVERHGGTINVESLPGAGTSFTVHLPTLALQHQGHRPQPIPLTLTHRYPISVHPLSLFW
jgi:nitrogen-specific signal transduction histidine kinase